MTRRRSSSTPTRLTRRNAAPSPPNEWSGWPDSNRRPPAPKAGALPLRYTPTDSCGRTAHYGGFGPAEPSLHRSVLPQEALFFACETNPPATKLLPAGPNGWQTAPLGLTGCGTRRHEMEAAHDLPPVVVEDPRALSAPERPSRLGFVERPLRVDHPNHLVRVLVL